MLENYSDTFTSLQCHAHTRVPLDFVGKAHELQNYCIVFGAQTRLEFPHSVQGSTEWYMNWNVLKPHLFDGGR